MNFNILYLTNIFSDIAGGSEYVFWLYAKYMARRHKVYVICFKCDKSSLVRLKTEASNINIIELAPEVKHRGVLFQDFSANMKYTKNGFRILKKIYRDIDLAHSNTYIPVLLGGIAKKLFRVKHVVTIHDVGLVMGIRFLHRWFREGGSNAFASYVKALIGAIFENNIVNTVPKDVIVVPSLQSMHDVEHISLRGNEMCVLPNFIDIELYENYKSKFRIRYEPCVLCIGRLVFYKNVHMLVKAFSQVLRYRKDAKLIMIGRGPLGQLLYDWVRKQGLEKNILMLGAVDQGKKLKYLSLCSTVINLSIFEGFGLTTLESWYFEKPVIISDIPPLNELVEDSVDGYMIDLRDQNKLIELILQLLDDPRLAKKMGSNGLCKVLKYYSPGAVIPQLENIYNSIIS